MTFDELAELMEEPPGGHNHGRKRGMDGRWVSLETQDVAEGELTYLIHDPEYRDTQRYEHGTRSRYVHGDCRCGACRRANRDYMRARRAASGLADTLPEADL